MIFIIVTVFQRTGLLYDAEPKMSYVRSLDRLYAFQVDRPSAEVIEQAHTSTEQDGRHVDMYFINQPCFDGLLQDTGCGYYDVFISCGFLRLTDRAFNAIADKGERRTFLYPFLRRVVRDNESRGARRMSIPGMCNVEGSPSPNTCSIFAERFVEKFSALLRDLEHHIAIRDRDFRIS